MPETETVAQTPVKKAEDKKLNPSAAAWKPSPGGASKTPGSSWGRVSDAVKAAPSRSAAVATSTPSMPRLAPHRTLQNTPTSNKKDVNKGAVKGRTSERKPDRSPRLSHSHNNNGSARKNAPHSQPLGLCVNGEGNTDAAKKVRRHSPSELLAIRTTFLDPPAFWEEKVAANEDMSAWKWDSPSRVEEISVWTNGGCVSYQKNPSSSNNNTARPQKKQSNKPRPHETAPPLEECAPIAKNEETRWKAKIFDGNNEDDDDSDETIMKKALIVLNKLTLTKFDRLSDQFIETGIGRNEVCLAEAISLIVNKAQGEAHFAAMYAKLCLKLSQTPMEAFEEEGTKKGKKFKKMLLERCQIEFEKDTSEQIEEATKGIEDEAEVEYKASLIKKAYLGHMRFIGELYKAELLSIKIMLFCLPQLLKSGEDNKVDEDNIECFTKLMTTIGYNLEIQSENLKQAGKVDSSEALEECWKTVEGIAKAKDGFPQVAIRTKFMLQDLLEMKSKGWEARRKQETAKTIDQIHKEAEQEARLSRRASSTNLRRTSSSVDMRRRLSAKPQVDEDGFTTVTPAKSAIIRSTSDSVISRQRDSGKDFGEKVIISGGAFAALNIDDKESESPAPQQKTPKECEKAAKGVMNDLIIGGDVNECIVSLKQLVGEGDDGAADRLAGVIGGCCLQVLEMKEKDVQKFINLIDECFKKEVVSSESLVAGFTRPLDCLPDLSIDAPMATSHLVSVVASFITAGYLKFDFLLNAPEMFMNEGNPSHFAAKVLKKLGGDALSSEDNLKVLEELMSDFDREHFKSAAHLVK